MVLLRMADFMRNARTQRKSDISPSLFSGHFARVEKSNLFNTAECLRPTQHQVQQIEDKERRAGQIRRDEN